MGKRETGRGRRKPRRKEVKAVPPPAAGPCAVKNNETEEHRGSEGRGGDPLGSHQGRQSMRDCWRGGGWKDRVTGDGH